MPVERERRLASFFGTLSLLVMLRWCWIYVGAFYDELGTIHIDRAVLFERMGRMRPPLLRSALLDRYFSLYMVLAGLIALALWIFGVRRWWIGRRDDAPRGLP
jgi:hypothetical protein